MKKQATPAAYDLARWVLAQEVDEGKLEKVEAQTISNIFEQLRLHLSKLVGIAGFQALFARALALAKAEIGWLQTVRVGADGLLEGFAEAAHQQLPGGAAQGGIALLTQLLGLLMLFIGEDLTVRLVHDAWPDTLQKDRKSGAEETQNE